MKDFKFSSENNKTKTIVKDISKTYFFVSEELLEDNIYNLYVCLLNEDLTPNIESLILVEHFVKRDDIKNLIEKNKYNYLKPKNELKLIGDYENLDGSNFKENFEFLKGIVFNENTIPDGEKINFYEYFNEIVGPFTFEGIITNIKINQNNMLGYFIFEDDVIVIEHNIKKPKIYRNTDKFLLDEDSFYDKGNLTKNINLKFNLKINVDENELIKISFNDNEYDFDEYWNQMISFLRIDNENNASKRYNDLKYFQVEKWKAITKIVDKL